MSHKQSLYQLLGLTSKASPEDIRSAFAACLQALEQHADDQERRNRLSILRQVHDVLSDPRRRALYDSRTRARPPAEEAPPPSRSLWPAFALLLIAGAAYPAWRLVATERAEPTATAPPKSAQPAASSSEPQAKARDIEVMPPSVPVTAMPASAAAKPAAVPPPIQHKLVFDGPNAANLAKFSDSTYVIVGAEGQGTGVVIDHDKLLTNCHVIAPNVLKGPILAINPATRERTRITEAAFLVREDACVVHAPGLNGKPIAIGDAGRLARGARIFNIGFADGRLISSAGVLLGVIERGGQNYLASSNFCDHGVSGGPLVDEEGRLVGLTSGGPTDRSFCLSLTAETARTVLTQTPIAIDAFPPNYLSNLARRW